MPTSGSISRKKNYTFASFDLVSIYLKIKTFLHSLASSSYVYVFMYINNSLVYMFFLFLYIRCCLVVFGNSSHTNKQLLASLTMSIFVYFFLHEKSHRFSDVSSHTYNRERILLLNELSHVVVVVDYTRFPFIHICVCAFVFYIKFSKFVWPIA